jgi:glucose-1-phosphate adenylyltransferase
MPLQDVVAVVLGGGRGAGLYPLTKFRAKPAVPIGGKYRLIDISMSNCINSGITRIFVVTQFLSASLNRHVHRTYNFDVFSGGFVEILATEQTLSDSSWFQGTADAVRRQMDRIRSREPVDVLIPAGDHLYRMDYDELVRFHRENQADVTVAVVPVSAEDASRHTVLKANPRGRVDASRAESQDNDGLAEFKSCPGDWRPYLASMGLYLFRTDVLASLLEESGGESLSVHILPAAIQSARVFAYLFEGYWEQVGTLSAFYEANLALTRPNPPFDFYDPQRPIYSRSRFLPPSRLDDCRLERVVAADGCRLYEADIQECVIGLRSVVRPGARLRRVVLMGADFYETQDDKAENRRLGRPHVGIGKGASIERAVIDKNARIGKGVKIRSHEGQADRDEELYSLRDGIVVVPDNALIPDGTVI